LKLDLRDISIQQALRALADVSDSFSVDIVVSGCPVKDRQQRGRVVFLMAPTPDRAEVTIMPRPGGKDTVVLPLLRSRVQVSIGAVHAHWLSHRLSHASECTMQAHSVVCKVPGDVATQVGTYKVLLTVGGSTWGVSLSDEANHAVVRIIPPIQSLLPVNQIVSTNAAVDLPVTLNVEHANGLVCVLSSCGLVQETHFARVRQGGNQGFVCSFPAGTLSSPRLNVVQVMAQDERIAHDSMQASRSTCDSVEDTSRLEVVQAIAPIATTVLNGDILVISPVPVWLSSTSLSIHCVLSSDLGEAIIDVASESSDALEALHCRLD